VGIAQDMESVADGREPTTGARVHSLYGASAATLAPGPELLAGLDAVVVDLPDIGCRYYTFAATLAHVMAVCEQAGVEMIVCDRPNPLGGVVLEGGPVEPGCRSFVSELEVPVRHGMTIGELALLLRATRHPRLSLTIVPCRGGGVRSGGLNRPAVGRTVAQHADAADRDRLPGRLPGRGDESLGGPRTTRPFQLIGAPWLDGEALSGRLDALALPGARFRATRFRPEFSKHAAQCARASSGT